LQTYTRAVRGFAARLPAAAADAGTGARADAFDDDEGIDAVDHIDSELWPIFEEEAEELLPQLQSRLRDWLDKPSDPGGAGACMRTLHTLKGGARLAGAMRLGEMAHRLETAIEHLTARDAIAAEDIEPLLARADAMSAEFDSLVRAGSEPVAAPAVAAAEDRAAATPDTGAVAEPAPALSAATAVAGPPARRGVPRSGPAAGRQVRPPPRSCPF